MASAIHHAESAVRKWGGCVSDYLPISEWFDSSKFHLADFRHRAMHHHSAGIEMCEQIFGPKVFLHNEDGSPVMNGSVVSAAKPHWIPTKWVAERHVVEDMGRIPSAVEWLVNIQAQPWMSQEARRLSEER